MDFKPIYLSSRDDVTFLPVCVTECSLQWRVKTRVKEIARTKEHQSNVEKGEYNKSGIAQHSKECQGNIKFEDTETVVIYNKFDRKVRETLEIQKHDCHVKNGGMNPDKGKYVQPTSSTRS